MAEPANNDEFPPEVIEVLERHRDQLDAGLFSEAEESLEQLMECMGQHAMESLATDPDFQEQILASEYEKRGEWSAAQAIYERRLARCDPNDSFERAFRCKDLAAFHASRDELNLASLYRAQATYYFRRSPRADVGIWFWLMNDAILANMHGRYADALDAVDEALMDLTEERSFDHIRSILLISRARSQLGLGNLDAAEADHTTAWEHLAPWDAFEAAVGVLNAFALWWRLGARLWDAREDFEEARHCWQRSLEFSRRAVEHWDQGAPEMILPLSGALVEFGQFLLRHGEAAEAAKHFAESDQIRAQFNLAPLDHGGSL